MLLGGLLDVPYPTGAAAAAGKNTDVSAALQPTLLTGCRVTLASVTRNFLGLAADTDRPGPVSCSKLSVIWVHASVTSHLWVKIGTPALRRCCS